MFSSYEIAGLVYNRPLLILPEKIPLICAAIEGRTGVSVDEQLRAAAEAKITALPDRAQSAVRGPAKSRRSAPYPIVDNVALIQIHGSLVNRGAWIGAYSGVTSYEGIGAQLRHALDDPDTKAVILDLDSPGGQAAGAFETAALVRQVAAVKPVFAIINAMAASAAYAIASGATEIVIASTGVAGSIGVLVMHVDFSVALQKEGVKPTLIIAGRHKGDGNPYQALPESVRADIQAEVDQYYAMFVDTVAVGRKNLSAKQIRDTEAAVYVGADAISAGLADRIGDLETVLAELATLDVPPPPPLDEMIAKFTQADLDKASADAHARGRAEALEESVTDGGMAAAQARIKAIMALPEAKGRENTAKHLAMNGVPIVTAKYVLSGCITDAAALRQSNAGLRLVPGLGLHIEEGPQ